MLGFFNIFAVLLSSTALSPLAYTDHGDVLSPNSKSGGNTVHTFTSQTTTGPDTLVAVTWTGTQAAEVTEEGSEAPATNVPTLVSATWNGQTVNILVQERYNVGDAGGSAWLFRAGAQSGSLVLTFSEAAPDSAITKLSILNFSGSFVDTDSVVGTYSTGLSALTALVAPGTGGMRFGVFMTKGDGSAVTITNMTAIADEDAGSHRHVVAYGDTDVADTVTFDGNNNKENCACGTSLR